MLAELVTIAKDISGSRWVQLLAAGAVGWGVAFQTFRSELAIGADKLELHAANCRHETEILETALKAEVGKWGQLSAEGIQRKDVEKKLDECQGALLESQKNSLALSTRLADRDKQAKGTSSAALARERECSEYLARHGDPTISFTPEGKVATAAHRACYEELLHVARIATPDTPSVRAKVGDESCSCSLIATR